MRKISLALMLILVSSIVLAPVSVATNPAKEVVENEQLMFGNETNDLPIHYPPYQTNGADGQDLIGTTTVIGTTWYENQHNGTIGRMLAIDDSGYVHFGWMNGLVSGATTRHVYYNGIDPAGTLLFPTGVQVNPTARAGFTTLDATADGKATLSYHHQGVSASLYNTAISIDYSPRTGAFMRSDAPVVTGVPEVIWPKMMLDRNEVAHVVSCENPENGAAGDPHRQYYIPATYDGVSLTMMFAPEYDLISWSMVIAGDVATSDVSDRIAIAYMWCREDGFPPGDDPSQRNNDVYLVTDDDGIDPDFNNPFNVTRFIEPDLSYLPDTTLANQDTLRAYTDLNVFIDQNDFVHIVFTTPSYFELSGTAYWNASYIWHWSEEYPDDYSLVHSAFGDQDWDLLNCGAWNFKAQRPMLGQNLETGDLYCMYQVYDTDSTATSQGGFPSGEIYISKSVDSGQNWSVGTNVTGTVTPQNAAPGDCLSELTPSMAKLVDDDIHVMYVLDTDAGNILQSEGTWTLSDVIYHQVPTDQIPATPLVPQDVSLHVPVAAEPIGNMTEPFEFALNQNYPNPFNPTTSIDFSLSNVSDVELKVYNLRGEEVADLVSGTLGTGIHRVDFDASELSSGVYIYKLTAGQTSLSEKMVLLK